LDNIFWRLGSTDRYEKALQLLEEKENKIYSFDISCYEEFENSNSATNNYLYEKYCRGGYKKQSEKIRSKSLYKSWKNTDLALNIIRILITFECFAFLLFILLKYFNINEFQVHDSKNMSDIKKYLYLYFLTTLILSIFILVYSIMYFILKLYVDKANTDIGLYPYLDVTLDTWSDIFITGQYYDVSLMITSIVFFSLSLALKKAMNNNTELPQYPSPTITENNNDQGSSPNSQSGVTSPDGRQAQAGQSEERKIVYKP